MSDGGLGASSRIALDISREIKAGGVVGLGSGATVARVLRELAKVLRTRGASVSAVPTSLQIQLVAEAEGIDLVSFNGTVDLVVDGADQVDSQLNLIKGGGGALLKEKILMSSSKKNFIVADEEKFVRRLGDNSVRVPVEVSPFARDVVKRRLAQLGGAAEERLLPKGYPYYTENGNIILDTRFPEIDDPRSLEVAVDALPGVVESGIFTIKPITVFKLKSGGEYEVLTG